MVRAAQPQDGRVMRPADNTAPSPPSAAESAGLIALVLIISLFFLWGVANNLNDILI